MHARLISLALLMACAESVVPPDGDLDATPVDALADAHLGDALADARARDLGGDVSGAACEAGQVRGCGAALGRCEAGEQVCVEGRWSTCLGGIGPDPEVCNEVDDDCDGAADEGLQNACGGCGAVPEEHCNNADEDCDGAVDEGCECAEGAERDCGREAGECAAGLQRCGAMGWGACEGAVEPSEELCNALDEDCDGRVDEGTLNLCETCGPVPVEVCNGEDDDCDGPADEGTLNACGACGEVPAEVCNQEDDDCDGRIDEGRCTLYFLSPLAEAWEATEPADGPEAPVKALISLGQDDLVWVLTDEHVYFLNARTRRFTGSAFREVWLPELPLGLRNAHAVPAWWRPRDEPAVTVIAETDQGTLVYLLEAEDLSLRQLSGAAPQRDWADPLAPERADIRGAWLDILNHRQSYPGTPQALCGRDLPLEASLASLTAETLAVYDYGVCFDWVGATPVGDWPPALLPNAPPFAEAGGATHYNTPAAGAPAGHFIWVDR